MLVSKGDRKKRAMVRADKPVSRKRTILFLVLGLAGLISLLVGLSWEAVLRAFATDLARTENFFNLINPGHVSLAHAIVVGIVGPGHFLLVFGVAAMLVGLTRAIYTRLQSTGTPRWRAPGCRTFVIGSDAPVLLAVGAAVWASSTVSYEDELAAEPATAATSSAGHKEDHHADCALDARAARSGRQARGGYQGGRRKVQ